MSWKKSFATASLRRQCLKSFTVGHFRNSNSKEECNITYCNYKEELSVEDGVLFKAHRLVISTSLRAEYLKDLQTGYLAGETLLKAQETVFWSGISDYVRNEVKLCDVCQKYKPVQQKEPLIPRDNTLAKAILNRKISLAPWSKSSRAPWRRKSRVLILQY